MTSSTNQIARVIVATAAFGILGIACSEDPGSTAPFDPTHVGIVHGRVVSATGAALAGIDVFVSPNVSPGFGYAGHPVKTNASGQFTYNVSRMSAPRVVAQPDTVTAVVQAQRSVAGGAPVIGTTQVVITFVPYGAVPPVTKADVVLPVPNP